MLKSSELKDLAKDKKAKAESFRNEATKLLNQYFNTGLIAYKIQSESLVRDYEYAVNDYNDLMNRANYAENEEKKFR